MKSKKMQMSKRKKILSKVQEVKEFEEQNINVHVSKPNNDLKSHPIEMVKEEKS